MSAEEVAAAFVNHYYTTLGSNPSALMGLYQPQSVLTFEGQKFEGPQKIIEKLLAIGKVAHNIPMLTKDVQMSVSNSAMIIFVTGQLSIGGGNPLLFSQVFQLVATGPGQYYVHNEVFRLLSLQGIASSLVQIRTLKRPAVNTSQLKEGRRTGALAMKVGMLTVYDGHAVKYPVTVLQLDDCQVVQVKTDENNGYTALQLGVGEAKPQRVNLPLQGHFDKAGVKPKRELQEFRVSPDCLLPVGSTISAQHFVPGQLVDVCGTSKGKGFQGVMKRWNFRGGAATHGNSVSHRVPGSTGCRQDPGRVFKNKKMPGRMGSERVTVQNLKVMKIDPVKNLLFLHGAVPGSNGGFVRVVDAVKGPFYPSPPPVPTYTDKVATQQLRAPLPDKDVGDYKEPDDPY